MDFHRLILEHGTLSYLVTFLWTFFEGETFVIFAGFAASQGLVSWPLLLGAAWLGSFTGDQTYFWIGRYFGARLLARQPLWRARVNRALAWLDRYDAGFILTFRFIYGVRNFSSFALGVSRVSWQRFLILNFIAAGLWASIFVSAGFLGGHALGRMLGEIAQRFSESMLIVFAVALFAGHIAHRFHRHRRRKPAAAIPPVGG